MSKNAERDEAIARLREIVNEGDTLTTIVRHPSRSGMRRAIDVYLFRPGDGGRVDRFWLSRLASKATGFGFDEKHEALCVDGCGMDMGFHVVNTLSRVLFPDSDRPDYAINHDSL